MEKSKGKDLIKVITFLLLSSVDLADLTWPFPIERKKNVV